MKTLHVLVDYDNLVDFHRNRTVDAVLRHIESRIPDHFVGDATHVSMRLYGGWVTGQTLTRRAQDLSAAIQRSFPSTVARTGANGSQTRTIVQATLARSGLFLPAEDLRDTFMPLRSVGSIKIDASGWQGCAKPASCHLAAVEAFVQHGQCQAAGCLVSRKALLRRDEQKQVDTLLVADMAELVVRQSVDRIAVVSSDADMWPGILLCLVAGAVVLQVHTTIGRSTKPALKTNLGRLSPSYLECSV